MLSSIALNLNELPINDIFEKEIPYNEKYTKFQISILKKPFDDMTLPEFFYYIHYFYYYLSKNSAYYNRYENYRDAAANIRFLCRNVKSFYDAYIELEEAYTESD